MQASKLLIFVFVTHSLFAFAGSTGFVPSQDDGPRQEYIEKVQPGSNFSQSIQDQASGSNQSGFTSALSDAALGSQILGQITGLLFAPQQVTLNSGLPNFLKNMITGIITLLDIIAIASFARGGGIR